MAQFMEVKRSIAGNKVVALIDSTGNIREPQNGGDVIIPISLTQYNVLRAVSGEIKALGAIMETIERMIEEA